MSDAGNISADKIFSKGPCAANIKCAFCFSDGAVKLMRKIADEDYQTLISDALVNPDPNKQLELLYDHRTITALGNELYVEEFTTRFKPHSPQKNELFNNFNINMVLTQLHLLEPTFKNFDCELMDFYNNPNSALGKSLDKNSELISGIKSGEILTFGTVPNTLLASGDTTKVGHWVALFGDFRGKKFTIEYYNSSGSNAPAKYFAWMESLSKLISEETNCECQAINVSNISSQKGPSECGIYSIHYIICRLLGIPYKKFREHKISDNDVNKLRKLFLDASKVTGETLNVLRNYSAI
jgi:hypothetical protein